MKKTLFCKRTEDGSGKMAGSFTRLSSDNQPWKRIRRQGTLAGALIAVMLCVVSGCGIDSKAMNESTANVKHITDAEFDAEVKQATLPVVMDCYATWCGPCRQLAPIVDNLADEYAGKIKFVKVNVDESRMVSQKFQIQAIPTLLFFKDGTLKSTSVGLLTKAELTSRVDALLASKPTSAESGK